MDGLKNLLRISIASRHRGKYEFLLGVKNINQSYSKK